MIALSATTPASPPAPWLPAWLRELPRRDGPLAAAALIFLLAALPTMLAGALDERTVNDIDIWVKPTKFLLSLALYYATLAWFSGHLEPRVAAGRTWRRLAGLAIALGVLEMTWLIAAAVAGVPSHFNRSGWWSLAYALAGVGATLLLVIALIQAVLVARSRQPSLHPAYRLSVLLGALVSFVATMIVAGFMASGQGHWVAGAASDAGGLPLLGWSRDGGDLRVAHFFATHAAQVLPLAAFALVRARVRASQPLVWLACAAYVALIALAFVQALAGRPFLA